MDYNLILEGDGSGNTWQQPCGFACKYHDLDLNEQKLFVGATSHGSNNFAELFPYALALEYYSRYNDGRGRKRVKIVTDSELIAKCGNKEYVRTSNLFLWNAIAVFEQGFDIDWVWRSRAENIEMDLIAGAVRRNFVQYILEDCKMNIKSD